MSGALLKVMNRATRIERLILLYPLRKGGLTSIYHQARHASAEKKETSIAAREGGGGEVSMSVGEAVKETTKTVSYLSIIIAGLGVTGIMFYAIFRELFSSKSPNSVYAKALDKCLKDPRVQDSLGEPIKGFGEENSRGRRRYVRFKIILLVLFDILITLLIFICFILILFFSHIQYLKDGVNHLRMQFYLKGIRKSGTVHLEMKEVSKIIS
jgi:import inner membrane translocase subunit TIM21